MVFGKLFHSHSLDGALVVAEVAVVNEKRAVVVDIPVANDFCVADAVVVEEHCCGVGIGVLCMPLKCMKIIALLAWA